MKTMTRALLAVGMGSVVLLGARAAITGDVRSYVTSNFVLQLDGQQHFIKSIEGGAATAPPTTRGARKDGYAEKQNGPVRYSDAIMQIPIGAPKPLWDWINNFSSPAPRTAKEAVIVGLDYTLTEKSRRLLAGAKISKFELPACDGASKEPAYFGLALTPASVREFAGSGAKTTMSARSNERMWLPSNFALTIEGIDTTKVSKIDKIVIKHGDSGAPEYSDFEISVSEVGSATWKQWADAALAGKNVKKNARLDLLDPARNPLLQINLEGLGISGVVPEKAEANSDQIRRVTAQMYVEKITFTVPPAQK
jgi:hypothetical protein